MLFGEPLTTRPFHGGRDVVLRDNQRVRLNALEGVMICLKLFYLEKFPDIQSVTVSFFCGCGRTLDQT